jgi:hypothetical protein
VADADAFDPPPLPPKPPSPRGDGEYSRVVEAGLKVTCLGDEDDGGGVLGATSSFTPSSAARVLA